MIRAVVFDWVGTVVDHGSLAPMGTFGWMDSDGGREFPAHP